MFGKRGSAARTPRHRLIFALNPAVFVTLFEEVPDALNVEVGVGVIGVVPVHPLAQALGLFRDDAGEFLHTVHALAREFIHAIGFDIALAGEAQLLFHLDLDPESLRIKAIAIVSIASFHGVVFYKGILQRSSPDMVNTHGIVCRDGTVNKAVFRSVFILFLQYMENHLQKNMKHLKKR